MHIFIQWDIIWSRKGQKYRQGFSMGEPCKHASRKKADVEAVRAAHEQSHRTGSACLGLGSFAVVFFLSHVVHVLGT